ncbi:MAG TPA: NUDIX domain-containing protein [Chitinophagaceae bacterium]|nr:NUDIX domain-containing protein [Chitinophagaceae bacterium]
MFIKIYFNDKPLFLCDSIDEAIQPYVHHDDSMFIDELNSHTVKAMIHEMEKPSIHAGVFFHADLPVLQKSFFKKFKLVIAAGGLVLNEKEEILLIFRRGFWDLPKGKMEKKEKPEDCAIREVKEETGLANVKLVKPLTVTWHTYHEGSHFILKESRWYTMKAAGNQVLYPQTAEDIHEVKWVPPGNIPEYFDKVYPSVRDVLQVYI